MSLLTLNKRFITSSNRIIWKNNVSTSIIDIFSLAVLIPKVILTDQWIFRLLIHILFTYNQTFYFLFVYYSNISLFSKTTPLTYSIGCLTVLKFNIKCLKSFINIGLPLIQEANVQSILPYNIFIKKLIKRY